MRIAIVTCILVFCVFSCKKEKTQNLINIAKDTSQTKVVILCEGNFMWSNASFDVYYPKTGNLISDAWKKQNGNKPLGDVLQSGVYANGLLWLVLNNSGKAVAVDPVNYTYQKSMAGFKSPRYALPVGTGQMWLTDLYDNALSVADINSGSISKKIPCSGWTEELLQYQNEVFVCNHRGWLYIYNATTVSLADSINLQSGSQWLVLDKNQKIWVLASDSGKCALYKVDPVQHKIENKVDLPMQSAQRLAISKGLDTLFYLSGGVYAMPIVAASAPTASIFSVSGSNFYGLGVDPFSGEVYVADAADYVSKGTVYAISTVGKERTHFGTGIIPGSFIFYR